MIVPAPPMHQYDDGVSTLLEEEDDQVNVTGNVIYYAGDIDYS